MTSQDSSLLKRLLVLGTGFGACSLVRKIGLKHYDVTVVSPRNHFLFTPLLPSTTVGTNEFRSIIEPIRHIRGNVRYLQASAEKIDIENQIVTCHPTGDGERFEITYDILVIGVGAQINTFNVPGVEEHALFLKNHSDARAIRQSLISNFESASLPNLSAEERKRLLHFVVVGGGPTGVEFAAELHDFLEEDLNHAFPLLASEVRITLVDAMDEILGSFTQELRKYAREVFDREKIEVRTQSIVKVVEADGITLQEGHKVECGLTLWCTGNAPVPFIDELPVEKDKAGRILIDEFLRIEGKEEIYAIGDCANMRGKEFPPTAQVAQQEGDYLARHLNRIAKGRSQKPFEYKHLGMLAYIGGRKALADLPNFEGAGFTTWLFWRSAYLTKLVSLKNKFMVLFDWFRTFLFGRDISRF